VTWWGRKVWIVSEKMEMDGGCGLTEVVAMPAIITGEAYWVMA